MNNRVILISGGTGDIGLGIVKVLSNSHNNQIIIIGRSEKKLKEIQNKFKRVKTFSCINYSNLKIRTIISKIIKEFGSIDILINATGTFTSNSIENITHNEWKKSFEANVDTTFIMFKQIVPLLKTQKQGQIINICSGASNKAFKNSGAYVASKFAQEGLIKVLRKELKETNIAITNIYIGKVDTHLWKEKPVNALNIDNIAQLVKYILDLPPEVIIPEINIRHIKNQLID